MIVVRTFLLMSLITYMHTLLLCIYRTIYIKNFCIDILVRLFCNLNKVFFRLFMNLFINFDSLLTFNCFSGKLQVLNCLLRDLFLYKHRCLIFTQMARVLDILQAFLSFHGYQYFRLDGTTGIEQRQVTYLPDCLLP